MGCTVFIQLKGLEFLVDFVDETAAWAWDKMKMYPFVRKL